MLARRTPLKRTPFKRKSAETMQRVVVRDDGREILNGAAWQERREECFKRARGLCECGCGVYAPLHNVHGNLGTGVTVLVKAGEAHHKRKRGSGGGFRDDRLENLEWLTWSCHRLAHVPRKVVPKKVRDDAGGANQL